MKKLCTFVIGSSLIFVSIGCTPATKRAGVALRDATIALPFIVGKAALDGVFDSDDPPHERMEREDCERAWKSYWLANPEFAPAMAEHYRNEK